jgi:hypothetical protein
MPSPKYTKIEITPKAYLALEAESILQRKSMKSLASELILKGVSQESLEFIQKAIALSKANTKVVGDDTAKVIKNIGISGIKFDDGILLIIQEKLQQKGYIDAMLHVAQHTTSMQRDELHRVLNICEYHKLPPVVAANIVINLNKIESGEFFQAQKSSGL